MSKLSIEHAGGEDWVQSLCGGRVYNVCLPTLPMRSHAQQDARHLSSRHGSAQGVKTSGRTVQVTPEGGS
eukprot:6490309-Amphidinium_carterae.2